MSDLQYPDFGYSPLVSATSTDQLTLLVPAPFRSILNSKAPQNSLPFFFLPLNVQRHIHHSLIQYKFRADHSRGSGPIGVQYILDRRAHVQ